MDLHRVGQRKGELGARPGGRLAGRPQGPSPSHCSEPTQTPVPVPTGQRGDGGSRKLDYMTNVSQIVIEAWRLD